MRARFGTFSVVVLQCIYSPTEELLWGDDIIVQLARVYVTHLWPAMLSAAYYSS